MIVVVGRPALRVPDGRSAALPGGLTAEVAMGLAGMGVRTELLGSVGEDDEGDRLVLELGRAGVGHAAVLRDPAARTLLLPAGDGDGSEGRALGPSPRLEAADIELGLRYLPDCRVLILAELLEEAPRRAALEGAAFHGAAIIAVVPEGWEVPEDLAARATILALPVADPEGDAADPLGGAAFSAFLTAYAAGIAHGSQPSDAFRGALEGTGWQPSGGRADRR